MTTNSPKARLRLTQLTLKCGTVVDLPSVGVLCIVGGNNVGKSRLLADIGEYLNGQPERMVVLSSLKYAMEIDDDNVADWARANSIVTNNPGQPEMFAPSGGGGSALQLNQIEMFYGSRESLNNVRFLTPWFFRTLDAGQRANTAIAGMSMPGMGFAGNPLTELYRDGDKEAKLSDICLKTFGFPLTLDRANMELMLRVGVPGVASPLLQHPTREYADAVLALDPLREQGDGVKNYLGMVLHLMTATESITVIDEPEAFLHPAQARALGRHLGSEALENERQLLTATHDRDFVLGLLEADCPVTFLRINRLAGVSSAATLDSVAVKAIWDKPVLRYSNVLQGLFHRVVVVCEGDADCRWYGAVLDILGRSSSAPSEEALFVPSGGKDQVRNILEALSSLDVLSFAIVDFDVLLDRDYVGKLLDALGGDRVEGRRLSTAIGAQLTKSEQRDRAKTAGLAGLPAGDVTRMAAELISLMADVRVLVVPVGELESFDRSIGGHGPSWVTSALAAGRHKFTPSAEAILLPVLNHLG